MGKSKDLATGAAYQDQTESDTRYANVSGDTFTGDVVASTTLQVGDTSISNQYGSSLGYVADFKASSGGQTYISIAEPNASSLGDNGLVFGEDASAAYLYQRQSKPINFGTDNNARMRINAGGNISVPNYHDVVISKQGCLRAGNADTIKHTAAGSNVTSTTMLGCSHVYNQNFSTGRYMHLKTNHPVGSGAGEYSMILFEYIGYRYSPAATVHTIVGFHPWGTAIYNASATNNGNIGTFHNNEYKSSDNYVVLVVDAGTTSSAAYLGFTLNAYITHTGYPNLLPLYYNSDGQLKITATSLSSSTSGVY